MGHGLKQMRLVHSTTKKQPPPWYVYIEGDLVGGSKKPIRWRVDGALSVFEMMESYPVPEEPRKNKRPFRFAPHTT